MRFNDISITNVVHDWADDNGIEMDEINESLLIKWAIDAHDMMNLVETLKPKVALLNVENSRAEFPLNFKILTNAAANVNNKDGKFVKTRREWVSQWIDRSYEGCEVQINVVCDKCHKKDCNHMRFEAEVDKDWEMAHPEIYYRNYKRLGRFGYGPQYDGAIPRWELMRAAVQDFHKLNLIVGDCPGLNCIDCARTFSIQPPYLEVDFNEGEVLLSYLGRAMDEYDNPMIPNQVDALEAIKSHMEYKWYGVRWKRENDRNAKVKSDEALQMREINMGLAKSIIETPEYLEFNAWFNTQFYKRQPDLNMTANLNKQTRDKYDTYSDKLRY